jgi:hypothetical protein
LFEDRTIFHSNRRRKSAIADETDKNAVVVFHEKDNPFYIVSIEKEVQASVMHQRRFMRKRVFANKKA